MSIEEAAASVREAIRHSTKGLMNRDTLAELLVLAAVAGEHLLVIGPPGTAKSLVVRHVAHALGGNYFEYLLGRFTEPNEIFGPVDLRKLREGVVETQTSGMMPEADIAFLDEVFLGSTAILNTLLGILNERRFKRGHTVMDCPLRVCVGASNRMPEDESLAAFADRFLLHLFLEPLPDRLLEDLLEGGWAARGREVAQSRGLDSLDQLSGAVQSVDLDAIRPHLADAFRMLRKAGLRLSDRRLVKSQSLIAAAAVLAGRTTATPADLWPLVYILPDLAGQELAQDTLRQFLSDSENHVLPSSAEQASSGSLAKAQCLAAHGVALLDEPDSQSKILKLEALGREIEAGFSSQSMPQDLAAMRDRVAKVLETHYANA